MVLPTIFIPTLSAAFPNKPPSFCSAVCIVDDCSRPLVVVSFILLKKAILAPVIAPAKGTPISVLNFVDSGAEFS